MGAHAEVLGCKQSSAFSSPLNDTVAVCIRTQTGPAFWHEKLDRIWTCRGHSSSLIHFIQSNIFSMSCCLSHENFLIKHAIRVSNKTKRLMTVKWI